MKDKKNELLNEAEAAEFLGLSMGWLRASRTKNPQWVGPRYTKRDGWKIEYQRSDLVQFRETRQARTRTVDPADRMRSAQGKAGAK